MSQNAEVGGLNYPIGYRPAALRAARVRAGLSAAELASRLGVPVAAIYRWETGNRIPKTTRLADIATALGIAPAELLEEPTTLAGLRNSHGLAQQTVADALGISRVWLSYLESGRRAPSDEHLTALAELYHVDPDTIRRLLPR